MLRTLGRTLAKLRRMSTDLRKQSGIDEIIREEGLQEELATLRSLRNMSAAGALDSFIEKSSRDARKAALLAAAATPTIDEDDQDHQDGADNPYAAELPPMKLEGTPPNPAAEYPEIGCDSYGAAYESRAVEEIELEHATTGETSLAEASVSEKDGSEEPS